MQTDQEKCEYCGRPTGRKVRWWFLCPCGRIHHFCGFCYHDLRRRKIIVRRGQRGGGKKEFLKACPNGGLAVAEALMGRPRFKVAWESKWP